MKARNDRLTNTQQLPSLETRKDTSVKEATVTAILNEPTANTVFIDDRPRSTEGLDGAPRTTKTEQVFTKEERLALQKKIPCPALAGMFTSGMLKVGKDGTGTIPDLDDALKQVGQSSLIRTVLKHGADNVDEKKGTFNLFQLNGSSLDHTGSSGIRQNGTYPERFDLLVSFSKDGKTLTPDDLAQAAKHFEKESPGLRGALTQITEMSILLETFGSRDDWNRPFFHIADAKKLWLDGEIPESWTPPLDGEVTVRLNNILATAAKMKLDQIF